MDIVIIGGGGFGKEVLWLIERINADEKRIDLWNVRGFIDDGIEAGTDIYGYPVLGGMSYLTDSDEALAVACAIGSSVTRKKVIDKIKDKENLLFPNLIDPSVIYANTLQMGRGNIICAGNIMTVGIQIGDFVIINLDCTVGHEAVLESFVTIYPSVNVSGDVVVKNTTELGTGTQIIQGKCVGSHTIIGAGSVVVKDIPDNCTAVGSPARPIKYR